MPEIVFTPLWWDGTTYSKEGDGSFLIGGYPEEDVRDISSLLTHITAIHGHSFLNVGTASSFADADVISAPPVDGAALAQGVATATASGAVLRSGAASATGVATAVAAAEVILLSSRLVNTSPGEDPAPIEPGKPIHMGLKSVTGDVQIGSTRINIGLSGLVHEGVLPENNENLVEKGLEVLVETSERRRPVTGTAVRTSAGSAFTITKGVNDLGEFSVYELKTPIQKGASLLARVKLRKTAWSLYDPDWMNLNNMTGVYIGLEHGNFNTAANVFLRNDGGNGQIILGGPLQAFDAARPGQIAEPFPWPAFVNGSTFEIYIYFDLVGRFPPFSPPLTPIVEVWTKTPNDNAPVIRHIVPVGTLGQFPDPESSIFPNVRHGPDEIATLFIGNIGQAGDVLQVEDWEFYPDFRKAVVQGEPLPHHEFKTLPDAPVSFRSDRGKLPTKLDVGRWFKLEGGSTQAPNEGFHYQPGRRSTPQFTTLTKPFSAARMGLQKKEPRLELRNSGMMIEAFISGTPTDQYGHSLGMGIGLDDGTKSYRACLLNDSTIRTVGIAKDDGLLNVFSGYHLPVAGPETLEVDHRSLKFVRLLVDRYRDKVALFVEDEDTPILEIPLSSTFPNAVVSDGRAIFGHFDGNQTSGKFNLAFVNYLTQYAAWEGRDGLEPDDVGLNAGVQFTEVLQGNGSSSFDALDNSVLITKEDFTILGSKRFFSKTQPFIHEGGVQVDFRCKVLLYTDKGGQQNAPKTDVGVGLRIHFGNKLLHVGFYDCGIHGQKIAVLPGSGTATDILEQTELGRRFSADANFFDWETYRVSYKAFDRIEIWANTVRNKPLISIPWTSDVDGFDLPLEPTASSIRFGHFEQFSSSQSKWQFVRWGASDGYECAVTQLYPEGLPKYLFGGRALIITEFGDSPFDGVDSAAPLFAGATSAVQVDSDTIDVSWSAANDDFSPDSAIVYDIWVSGMSGGHNFSNPPTFTTSPGALQHSINGLNAGTTYYFVVRARDQNGNRDGNTVEVFATTAP